VNGTDIPFLTHDPLPPPPPPPLPPTLTTQPASGLEQTAIPLSVAAAGNGGGTVTSLVISNIPIGATLSDGTKSFTAQSGSTSVDVIGWNLSTLTITTTNDTNFTLSVTATTLDGSGHTVLLSTTELVTVFPLAPSVSAVEVKGIEGAPIALNISASATGHSTFSSLLIGNIPVGPTLHDALPIFTAQSGSTSIDIIGWNLSTLTIKTASDANFTLNITATSADSEGQTNTASTGELMIVDPLAPIVSTISVEGVEGTRIALK